MKKIVSFRSKMQSGIVLISFGLILIHVATVYGHSCVHIPDNLIPTSNDKYIIEISGNPEGYTPGENYTITLTLNPAQQGSHFTDFTIVLESRELGKSAGDFHTLERLTAFHQECPLTVIQASNIPKKKVEILWEAPKSGNGCVTLKAIVSEELKEWYAGGRLTKTLCEAEEESLDKLPEVLEVCNACNEAKYEVAFQGLWSRNTHPNKFPEKLFVTKLGAVIGASHKYQKSFWDPASLASEGLQLLAEEGNTSLLETELTQMNKDIRTIIKAKELVHPNLTGTSYTVFRVDKDNHLISLVSKITPSPDWIVGVSNFDLCLENGSWATGYKLNLYPWDVGTDDGLEYTSPDMPSQYRQLIRPIKSNSPNTEESPFYDPNGEPIKPLARLHLTRKKQYDKECNSVKPESKEEECEFGEWSEWSSCSVTCGQGVRTRDRSILNPESCQTDDSDMLQETEICDNEEVCEETADSENDCSDSVWEPWSPCSVSCGNGTKERVRSKISEDETNDDENEEEEGNDACTNIKEIVECYNPPCTFGEIESGAQIRPSTGDGPIVDCKVSKWSIWSSCDMSLPCNERYKYRERMVLTPAQNGGKACPHKLKKKRKCGCGKVRVVEIGTRTSDETREVDCKMGSWSEWSPCSSTCGHAVQQRTRDILVHPTENGKPCGLRVQQKKCSLPLACSGIMSQYNNY